MIEVSEHIPFLWRLSSHNGEGFCMVSMVVPFNSGDNSLEHTIETNVLSFSSDSFISEEEEMLEWNEEDINLFLTLLADNAMAQGSNSDSIKVDLNDPSTIEIVQIVAAAGFGLAQSADDLLIETNNTQIDFDYEIGSLVSLHTVNGYKRSIVVDLDDDEAVCVMLEKVEIAPPEQFEDIGQYDLLLVKRHQILHPLYTSDAPTRLDVLH